jgi:hypothetical protein
LEVVGTTAIVEEGTGCSGTGPAGPTALPGAEVDTGPGAMEAAVDTGAVERVDPTDGSPGSATGAAW